MAGKKQKQQRRVKKPTCKPGTVLNPRTLRCVKIDRPLGQAIIARQQASNAEAAYVAKNVTSKIFNKVRKANYTDALVAKNHDLNSMCLEATNAIKYLQVQLKECDAKLRRSQQREDELGALLLKQRRV